MSGADIEISDDPGRLHPAAVLQLLKDAYWAQGRSLETQQTALANSLNFGVYQNERLIGHARVVTDGATFAWLCDVIIDPEFRGRGLGKQLVAHVVADPRVRSVRRFLLATRDAHGLYAQHGFEPLPQPDRWMQRRPSRADS